MSTLHVCISMPFTEAIPFTEPKLQGYQVILSHVQHVQKTSGDYQQDFCADLHIMVSDRVADKYNTRVSRC